MCWKSRMIKCERCNTLFYNVQYQTDDKICLRCFDKFMRQRKVRFVTLTLEEDNLINKENGK